MSESPLTLPEAIARYEGFYVAGSRAARNNNPGNIRWGAFAYRRGAAHGDDKGFAVFSSVALGWAALSTLLSEDYRGLTVEAILTRYAPPSENDTAAYIAAVCRWTGFEPIHVPYPAVTVGPSA